MAKRDRIIRTVSPIMIKLIKAAGKNKNSYSFVVYSKDGFRSKTGLINVDDCPMRKDYKDITRTFAAVNLAICYIFQDYGYTVEPVGIQDDETLEEIILRKANSPFKAMEWTIRW